jgi:hypothetical protein
MHCTPLIMADAYHSLQSSSQAYACSTTQLWFNQEPLQKFCLHYSFQAQAMNMPGLETAWQTCSRPQEHKQDKRAP